MANRRPRGAAARRAKKRMRERERAPVVRRLDTLDMERCEGRISEPAYLIGRIVERALARTAGPGTDWLMMADRDGATSATFSACFLGTAKPRSIGHPPESIRPSNRRSTGT
jgi:hypothetical protein